jgi:hypothetical protein
MPASFSLLLISSSISEYTHAHQEKHLIWELQNYGDGYNSNRTVEISDGSGKKLLMEFYLITYLFIYLLWALTKLRGKPIRNLFTGRQFCNL